MPHYSKGLQPRELGRSAGRKPLGDSRPSMPTIADRELIVRGTGEPLIGLPVQLSVGWSCLFATVWDRCRSWRMADQSKRSARLLVRALYHATDGEQRWWVLPAKLNDLTKEAIAVAVDRGWMLIASFRHYRAERAWNETSRTGRCRSVHQ